MCSNASWLPGAIERALCDRSPVLHWLSLIRESIEEYDGLLTVAVESDAALDTPDSAFDDILSDLGEEIYKLNEFQQSLKQEKRDLSLSVLSLFDRCVDAMTDMEQKKRLTDTSEETVDSIDNIFDRGVGTPVAPRRTRLKTPSLSSSIYENEARKRSESDSQSTCWSYQECSPLLNRKDTYSVVWFHSSGFHNSDEILRKVLSRHAAISKLTRGTDLHSPDDVASVPTMTGAADDGYEPVLDALTDENIYEEIELGQSLTDEGCSCGSVEVESVSFSSETGRDSPMYANLRDHDAYAIKADVIFWKNLLLDPFYNEDEEDEWITPEECAVYSREQRPPLVIPRITQHRPPIRQTNAYDTQPRDTYDPRQEALNYSYLEDKQVSSVKAVRQYGRPVDWGSEQRRGFDKANSDSPPFVRLHKRIGGSTENLLISPRRPTNIQLPASSSGDSLDVEVRKKEPSNVRSRKSRSMVAPKHRLRSPVPAPRLLLQHPEASILLEGPVKRTKFSEGGKKCKKNWTECYMILTQTALIFYKDLRTYNATKMARNAGTPPSPTAPRADLVLPLKNAHIVQCIQTHTRRYSRSLVLTVGYDQYLLQDDAEEGCKRWLQSIQNVIFGLGPPTLDEFPNHHYQSSNTDLESLGRTPPVSRHNRNKQKAGGSSNEDLSDSTEVSIQKSHVRSRLRKFFAKRPAMEVLVKKGIYKDEPVFGRNLEEVCPSTSPRVPEFVIACIREIERNEDNLCTDGLYRASGNLSQVQKVRLEVDQNNLSVIESITDVHVLTGSLKLFFRELKQPVIPCAMFDRVLSACSIKHRETRTKEFRDIVQSLPPCNRDTLKFLLEHLLRVTQYSERNRMHTANLAIVFGPTLLWAPAELAHNIAVDCIQQNNVVDILLTDYHQIFPPLDQKGKWKA